LIHHSVKSFADITGGWQFEPGLLTTPQLYNGWPLNLGARWFYVFSDFPPWPVHSHRYSLHVFAHPDTDTVTHTRTHSANHTETGVLLLQFCSLGPSTHPLPPFLPPFPFPFPSLPLSFMQFVFMRHPFLPTLLTWLPALETLSGWRS